MSDENATYEVDLADLQLTDEGPIEGLEPDADPSAVPLPLDDGVHQIQLSVSENKPKINRKKINGKNEFWVFVKGKVVEPGTPNDNKFCDDMVSTMVRQDSGACKAANFLKAVGVADGEIRQLSRSQMIAKVYQTLQGNPIAKAETEWQTRNGETNKTILRGQKRYQKINGRHQPLTEDPKTGVEAFTRAQIVRYVSIG